MSRALACLCGLGLALACSPIACSPSPTTGDAGADDADAGPLSPWLAPLDANPRGPFPAGFLWGSATSPFQIEGGLDAHTDWGAFDAQGGHVANGDHADDGPQSRLHYADDVQALVDTHQNAYRFGIEWARVFPTSTAWATCRSAASVAGCEAAADANELAYYHALIDLLKQHSIVPLVTLVHSSLPDYIDDIAQDWHTQGWQNDAIVDDLAAWAGFAAGEFGGDVHTWVTLNEPLTNLSSAYVDGTQPPGVTDQLDGLKKGFVTMVRAHAAMYDALHAASPSAQVSITQDVHLFYGETPGRPEDDQSAAEFSYFSNVVFLEAIVRGNLDADFSGAVDASEPHDDPTLRGRVDYIGLNYYGFSVVRGYPGFPLVDGVALSDAADHGLPKNDLGWDIYPRGFGEALDFAASFGKPIVVTENGLADATDANRPRFVAEHLAELAAKIAAGVDVRGYFHWATIDNFEWGSGFCPRFGLYRVDYADPNRARQPRPSAAVYRQIIDDNQVTDALLAAQPPYAAPSLCP